MSELLTERFLELGTLTAYLTVLLWIGIRTAKQVQTSEDYTLAGRGVPWVIVLATTAATMIGGGASVGMVSRVAEVGIAAALVTCGWHLQLVFTGLFVAPRLRGLNLITVGEYFELKFGPLARKLAVVNCVIFLVGALAAQMVAMGTVTNAVLGIRYDLALLIGAGITVFYSTVGGIRAVVKTDVLQFAILVVGIGAAAGILLARHGGFAALATTAQTGQFEVTSHWSTMQFTSLFVAYFLGETLVPPYAVRCFIAKDSQQARYGVTGAGIFLLLFLPIATFVLGTCAQVSPEVQQALEQETERIMASSDVVETEARQRSLQVAFPTLVRTAFHPLFSGIVVAAIIAAVMSSADSCLSCLATVVMEDAYRRHVHPAATDRQLLRVAKWTTMVTGVAAAVCAWRFSNIAHILEFVYDFWAPTMILPFLVALFWYRTDRIYAAVASMVAGMVSTTVWRFILNTPWDIGPALFGITVAIVTYFAAIPVTRQWSLTRMFLPTSKPHDFPE